MERKYYLPDEPIIFVTFPFDIVPGSSPIMIPWFAGGWGFGGGGRGLSFGGFGAPKFGAFEGICTTLSNNVWIDWIKLENYKRLILNNYKSPLVYNEQYLLWHLSLHLCLRRVLELLLNMLMWWTYWDYIGNVLVPCWNRLHFADLLRCFRNADISNIFIHDLWNILFSHNLASCNIKVNQILIKIIICLSFVSNTISLLYWILHCHFSHLGGTILNSKGVDKECLATLGKSFHGKLTKPWFIRIYGRKHEYHIYRNHFPCHFLTFCKI